MTPNIPVAILVRVSTRQQETQRQVDELQEVAARNGWTVVEVIEETVSGSSVERDGLRQVLDMARGLRIDKVLVHEVSRVARRNSVAHTFLDTLCDLGVSLYWHAQRIETLLPDGKRNPAAGVMFALLAELARNEKDTLVDRTISGLAAARRRGVRLGRPEGRESRDVFLGKHGDVVSMLRNGKTLRDAAARTGKSQATVLKVKKALGTAATTPR